MTDSSNRLKIKEFKINSCTFYDKDEKNLKLFNNRRELFLSQFETYPDLNQLMKLIKITDSDL